MPLHQATNNLRMASFLFLSMLCGSCLAYTALSDDQLQRVPSAGADFDIHNAAGLLAPILIPRVPDTPGSDAVQQHFINFFTANLPLWTISFHNHTATTPATGSKLVNFRNIILRRDPPGSSPGDVSRLTLAAHYDSLYHPEGFIGATDSAAPCAMLLHVARSVDEALTKQWAAADGLGEEKGVQILLLDGEEAWVSWTGDDNTYGSRSLAERWEKEAHPPASTFKHELDSISLFVLLDLLGAPKPNIPSYFPTTHWAYKHLASIEARMRELKLLETTHRRPFLPDAGKVASQFHSGYIQDDHVPFMKRGVDILHVIPSPFPLFWHMMEDDAEHLDDPTMQDWSKLITAFVAEWMDLGGHMPPLEQNVAADPYEKTEL